MKYLVTMPAVIAAMFFLYCLKMPLASAAGISVDARIGGVAVKTTVDSELARDLLEHPARTLQDPRLNAFPPERYCTARGDWPDAQELGRISRRLSVDTATVLLLRCLERTPRVAHAQQLFHRAIEASRLADARQREYLSNRAGRFTILFVPGWGYRSAGDRTGSDMRLSRDIVQKLGYEAHLVELLDYGTVEENARLLSDTLGAHLGKGKRVLLASASSGGPAVALALNDPAVFEHPDMAGWINICGVLHGSPIVDRFLSFPGSLLLHLLNLFEGWTYDELLSLSRRTSKPRYENFRPPKNLTVLNYIGIPLSGQVSDTGRTLYRLLRDQGPNDGLTLISDALAPGYTIMAIGSDHFIAEDPEIDVKTAALLPVVLKLIEEKQALSAPESLETPAQASALP